MNAIIEMMPEGFMNLLGWVTFICIFLFKDKLLRVLKKEETEPQTCACHDPESHNPNFITMDKKLDDLKAINIDIKGVLIVMKTIMEERRRQINGGK